MAKKKKAKTEIAESTPLAILNAFKQVEGLAPINLMRGRSVNDCLSTGSLSLDLILGGGFQRGRFATIAGGEAVGKSTMVQTLVVSAQKAGIPIVVLDPESGADTNYWQTQGIDLDYKIKVGNKEMSGLYYDQPDTGEQAYRFILQTLQQMPVVESGPPTILFIIDSFAAMVSEEVDDETGKSRISPEARMHSNFWKLIKPQLRKKGALLVGVNQLRTKINSYGAPEDETGGKALRYYPDYKIRVNRRSVKAYGKDNLDSTGVKVLPVTWKTIKNKLFPSHRSVEMQIIIGRGFDQAWDTHEFLKQIGHLKVTRGRRRILFPPLDQKLYDWPKFRRLSQNQKFRDRLFNLLGKPSTYEKYFRTSGETSHFFDEEYGEDEDVEIPNEVSLEVEGSVDDDDEDGDSEE